MPAPFVDRNLLFAVLALQTDLVARDDLLAGLHAWALDKRRPLGELLARRGALSPGHLRLLEELLDAEVKKHGSARRSLRALDVAPSGLRALAGVSDEEVRACLGHVSTGVDPSGDRPTVPAGSRAADHRPPAGGRPRYRVLRPHGKGGLGEVFVAEDLELRREIALKEIQQGHAADEGSRGRFVREAEVTGRLEHPGIVPVYGLGHYDDGRPFYAMRLVKGDNLKSAIERFHAGGGRFDTVEFRQLLGRFVSVCQAVAYAHSQGVLHRDLKPSNVMLGTFGETLVIDWGLAKVVGRAEPPERPEGADEPALTPASGGGPVETLAGSAIGTPGYMSPEQAAGRLDQLGPATDVYSLGATLRALLTNRAPDEGDPRERPRKARPGERHLPRQVSPAVPAALEAVCLKAMAPSPEGRYPTALALAQDLERWLADEPVGAYREPAPARARRWGRKHPGTVAALMAAALVGLIGAGAGAAALGRKNRQLEEAARSEHEAKERAEARLGQAEKANEILGSIFEDLDPRAEEKEGKPLREILGARLGRATAALDAEAIGDPLTVAGMQVRLGRSHLGLGYPGEAVTLFERAVATLKAEAGEDHPHTLASANNLASAYQAAGRLDLALPLYERTLKATEARLGEDHPEALASRNNLAGAYRAAGKLGLAIPLLERTLKEREARSGEGHRHTLASRTNLALAYQAAGRLDLAIPLYERTLKAREAKLGDDHADTLASRGNLGSAYRAAGKLDLAIPLLERALKAAEVKLGEGHPSTLNFRDNLALAFKDAGKLDQAIGLLERTLKAREERMGENHPHTLTCRNNLAGLYWRNKQLDRSVPLFEDLLRRRRARSGDKHPDTFTTAFNLGVNYRDAGRLKEAVAVFDEWLPRAAAALGPGQPPLPFARRAAADTYTRAGRSDKAAPLLGEDVAALRKQAKPDDARLAAALALLGDALLRAGKPAEAEPALRECLALREKGQPDEWATFNTMSALGEALVSRKKYAEAEPLLVRGYEGLAERKDKIPLPFRGRRLEEALGRLVQLCDATGKNDEGAKWRKRLAELKGPAAKGAAKK
jgi:hypothetical protein